MPASTSCFAEELALLLGAVEPVDRLGLAQGGHLFHPAQELRVAGRGSVQDGGHCDGLLPRRGSLPVADSSRRTGAVEPLPFRPVSWLSWIVVGLVAGGFAKVTTGIRGAGCLGTMLIGIVGGLLGGILFTAAGGEGMNDFSLYSVLVAFVGATILLFLYGLVSGHDRDRQRLGRRRRPRDSDLGRRGGPCRPRRRCAPGWRGPRRRGRRRRADPGGACGRASPRARRWRAPGSVRSSSRTTTPSPVCGS